MGLVLGQRRAATVRAVTHCDLYRLDRELFERVLAHHPGIAEHLSGEAERRRAALDASTAEPLT
jgi:CRP-like cAMP-binding protein